MKQVEQTIVGFSNRASRQRVDRTTKWYLRLPDISIIRARQKGWVKPQDIWCPTSPGSPRTDDVKQSCKFHTDPTWTIAMAWLLFFKGGSADLTWWPDLTWPDLGPKNSQSVRNEFSLKVRKLHLSISSCLAMAHENPKGASEAPPPAKYWGNYERAR